MVTPRSDFFVKTPYAHPSFSERCLDYIKIGETSSDPIKVTLHHCVEWSICSGPIDCRPRMHFFHFSDTVHIIVFTLFGRSSLHPFLVLSASAGGVGFGLPRVDSAECCGFSGRSVRLRLCIADCGIVRAAQSTVAFELDNGPWRSA